ncbi:MAG: hypothetical protein WCR68_03460 [Candidatus Dojkabacteria bacterium]|jgi:hypothetical protein
MKERIREKDFTKKELPKNRWELFRDLLLNHTATLINTSLLTALFALPFIVVFALFYSMLVLASNNQEPFNVLFSLLFYGCLSATPALILALVGLSGAFGVAKRLVWGEGVMLKIHFFSALKSEFKKTIIISVIIALSSFCLVVGGVYLSIFYVSAPIPTGIGIGLLAVQFLLITMTGCYFYAYQSVYQNNFAQTFKNSFLIATARLPFTLLFYLISPGIILVLTIVHYIASFIALFLFVLFSFGGVVLWTLMAHSSFDRFINAQHYPAYVRRGLYTPNNKKEEEVG